MSKIAQLIAAGVHVLPDRNLAENADAAFSPEDALDRITSVRGSVVGPDGPIPVLAIGHAVSPTKATEGGLRSILEAQRTTFAMVFAKLPGSDQYQLTECVGRVDPDGMAACVAYLKQQFGEEVEMPTLANA